MERKEFPQDVLDKTNEMMEQAARHNGVVEKLFKWCVMTVYTQCRDDNNILATVCDSLEVSEAELFDAFEDLSQDGGFDLDEE